MHHCSWQESPPVCLHSRAGHWTHHFAQGSLEAAAALCTMRVLPLSKLVKTLQSCSLDKASSRQLGAHLVAQLLEDVLPLVGGARWDWDLRGVLHKALARVHGRSGDTSDTAHSVCKQKATRSVE